MSITNLTDNERKLQEENERLKEEIVKYRNVIDITQREVERMTVRIRDLETHVKQLHNIGQMLDRKAMQK
jgi:predicted RNase H-like nuclease (RuvC/YqgF family)